MAKLLLAALCLLGAGVVSAQDENYLEATTQLAGAVRGVQDPAGGRVRGSTGALLSTATHIVAVSPTFSVVSLVSATSNSFDVAAPGGGSTSGGGGRGGGGGCSASTQGSALWLLALLAAAAGTLRITSRRT